MNDEPTRDYPATRLTADAQSSLVDSVAVEQPVAILLNGTEIVTLLCTPTDLDALAVGYLASERYIARADDVSRIRVADDLSNVDVITAREFNAPVRTGGAHAITSGCAGGRISRDILDLASAWRVGDGPAVNPSAVRSWMKEFAGRSSVFHETGGVHSAAIHVDNRTVAFSEDIGRHNAVDKVLGRAMLDRSPLERAVVLTSGRISAEVVVKCALRRVSVIVSRGAATSLAIDLADRMGSSLIGFTRGPRMTVYTHIERVAPE